MVTGHRHLAGRVAAITGGSGILGRAMGQTLAAVGVKVAILSRTRDRGEEAVQTLAGMGAEAYYVPCDTLDAASVQAAREAVFTRWGRCDILINAAGGNHPQATTADEAWVPESNVHPTFFDLTPEGFRAIVDANLLGAVIASQAFAVRMAGQDPPGVIVNLSSMSAPRPMTRVPAYSAAKAGLENFTKWLAVYLAHTGIRVNALAPGFFLTAQNRALLLNADGQWTPRAQRILDHTPMGRLGQPEDLAGTLLWLVDEAYSGFVTGVTIPVDGGFLAYAGV
ncbi:MAG: SDR family oxidoreductase [Firmicutes bacterium]|nr:SDR family oxidoreductase [Bacillota bacterium]